RLPPPRDGAGGFGALARARRLSSRAVAPDRENAWGAAQGERCRRLLVLGAGPGQRGLLEAARSQGIWTAVCDRDPGAPGFALADRPCIASTADTPPLAA